MLKRSAENMTSEDRARNICASDLAFLRIPLNAESFGIKNALTEKRGDGKE